MGHLSFFSSKSSLLIQHFQGHNVGEKILSTSFSRIIAKSLSPLFWHNLSLAPLLVESLSSSFSRSSIFFTSSIRDLHFVSLIKMVSKSISMPILLDKFVDSSGGVFAFIAPSLYLTIIDLKLNNFCVLVMAWILTVVVVL